MQREVLQREVLFLSPKQNPTNKANPFWTTKVCQAEKQMSLNLSNAIEWYNIWGLISQPKSNFCYKLYDVC